MTFKKPSNNFGWRLCGIVLALLCGTASLKAIDTPQPTEPLYQLFVWMKNGEKTGYLSTDRPQIRLGEETVQFSTDLLSFDIAPDDLDKFTLEQVLPEHPTDITVADTVMVGLGRKVRLSYTLTPADAETQVTWLNSHPEIVAVDASGWATGLQVGTADMKAQTSNGLRAEFQVVVPEPLYRFYVWLRNGTIEGYAIEEKPEVAMGDELFTLTTTATSVGYAAKDVLKFTLSDAAVYDPVTDISPIALAPRPDLAFRAGTFSVTNARPGTFVRVTDIQGRLVASQRVGADGTLSIPVSEYPSGIYLIQTELSTYKIIKK